jgi:hypothetical protein
MPKKLTITVDAEVYDGVYSAIGRRRISRFLNDLAQPHVVRGAPDRWLCRNGSRRGARNRGGGLGRGAGHRYGRTAGPSWMIPPRAAAELPIPIERSMSSTAC